MAPGFDVPTPNVTFASSTNGPPSGGVQLTLQGQNFRDEPDQLLMPGGLCAEYEYVSTTSIACAPAPAVDRSAPPMPAEVWVYDAPVLSHAVPRTALSLGGVWLTIGGLNLGVADASSSRLAVGATACDEAEWASESAVRCLLPPGQPGGAEDGVLLTVDGGGGTGTAGALFDYELHEVSGSKAPSTDRYRFADGHISITLGGDLWS